MTRLSGRKYWVFDMDGTLTVAVHDFNAIRDQLGLPQGRPILEQLAQMPEERAGPLRDRLDEIEKDLALRATSQAGANELLEVLGGRGARMGILTRNSHENALATLEACGLAAYFEPGCVLGRESCRIKPSADGIRKLLGLWRAPAGEAVMVGDYLFDLIAGREAGTATVYIDTTGRFEYKEHADVCVRDLLELAELVRA
jgi:phosphoglycolate phosphatase-like HAD superfamily hydrolase